MRSTPNELGPPALGQIYDALFATKPYSLEVESLIRAFGGKWRSGLDLGCGTGSHTIELALRGLRMTGIDRSPEMISQAESKRIAQNLTETNVSFSCGTFPDVPIGNTDVVTALFNVVNYCLTELELHRFFQAIYESSPNADVCIDMWDSEVARLDPPHEEVREFSLDGVLARISIVPLIDPGLNLCAMQRNIEWQNGSHGYSQLHAEVLWHRIWTKEEVRDLVKASGFENVEFYDWNAIGGPELKCRRTLALIRSSAGVG